MAIVTVTSTIGSTCHYWFNPKALISPGSGIVLPDIVHGWIGETADNTPVILTIQLDNTYLWDVTLEFRNAPPIRFEGYSPSNGDLLTQLTAQGWIPL